MDDNDPRTVFFSFLDALPQTIRTEALLFVIMYAMDSETPTDTSAFSNEVKHYLMRSGIAGISAVICTLAAIDHSFEGIIASLVVRIKRLIPLALGQVVEKAQGVGDSFV